MNPNIAFFLLLPLYKRNDIYPSFRLLFSHLHCSPDFYGRIRTSFRFSSSSALKNFIKRLDVVSLLAASIYCQQTSTQSDSSSSSSFFSAPNAGIIRTLSCPFSLITTLMLRLKSLRYEDEDGHLLSLDHGIPSLSSFAFTEQAPLSVPVTQPISQSRADSHSVLHLVYLWTEIFKHSHLRIWSSKDATSVTTDVWLDYIKPDLLNTILHNPSFFVVKVEILLVSSFLAICSMLSFAVYNIDSFSTIVSTGQEQNGKIASTSPPPPCAIICHLLETILHILLQLSPLQDKPLPTSTSSSVSPGTVALPYPLSLSLLASLLAPTLHTIELSSSEHFLDSLLHVLLSESCIYSASLILQALHSSPSSSHSAYVPLPLQVKKDHHSVSILSCHPQCSCSFVPISDIHPKFISPSGLPATPDSPILAPVLIGLSSIAEYPPQVNSTLSSQIAFLTLFTEVIQTALMHPHHHYVFFFSFVFSHSFLDRTLTPQLS